MTNHANSPLRLVTPQDCVTCPAREMGLFAYLDPSERGQLLGDFRIVPYRPGEVIYHYGDPGEHLFVLHFGLVKKVRYSASGTERIVALARSGDTIGLVALSHSNCRRTAIAVSACELCRIPVGLIRQYAQEHPQLFDRLLKQYQAREEMADTFLTELSTGTAQARVARLLLFLAGQQERGEAPLFSREEMGAILGITTETASRVVADFRRRGLIAPVGEHRVRCEIAALEAIASQ